MDKFKIFVAESVSPKDFYKRRWEGYVVEEIVRLLGGFTSYRIVMNAKLLHRAIRNASVKAYNVFHMSCHGDKNGIRLTDKKDISWNELANVFQEFEYIPSALIISSCLGGDVGLAKAFEKCKKRPDVIFGTESEKDKITFDGACLSWPILYSELVTRGMKPKVFKDAIDKMNKITPYRFVYRRWDSEKEVYKRYPAKQEA